MQVPQFLAEHQVVFETIAHPPAFTAQKRAKFLHLPGRQVAKTVLLAGPDGYFLAVVPATHQVDTGRLTSLLGGPVRLAAGEEIAQVFRDCEWGVVPPFGHLYGLATMIDEALDPDAPLVFEGHTHGEAIRLRARDYERLERPRRLRFSRPAVWPRGFVCVLRSYGVGERETQAIVAANLI
jgi:Ala-tRNA(Pro) deacylase